MFLRRVGGSRLLRSMEEHQVHMVHMLHVEHILVHMKHIFTCTIMCTYFPACFYGVWEARDSSEACRNTRYTWSTCSTWSTFWSTWSTFSHAAECVPTFLHVSTACGRLETPQKHVGTPGTHGPKC